MRSIAECYRPIVCILVGLSSTAVFAQQEPIESVVNRYQSYVQALQSPLPQRRVAAMNDFTDHYRSGGYRGLPPTTEEDPKQASSSNPEWVAKDLYRQIVILVKRCAKQGDPSEYRAALQLACVRFDCLQGEVIAVNFGDLRDPPVEHFDDDLLSDIKDAHPDWCRSLVNDADDLIAITAIDLLAPEEKAKKLDDWANDFRPARRSRSMLEHIVTDEDGLPAIDHKVALQFLDDESFDLRWLVFNFVLNSLQGLSSFTPDLVPKFRKASPNLKWSILLFCTFNNGTKLIPEAKKLRFDKDPALRAEALMFLNWHEEKITDQEVQFGFTNGYRELKHFWLDEIEKRPGLKDFAKHAREEVKALGW